MTRPLLLVVSGPPGAGKSTLAKRLGAELGLPIIDRDDFKDALFDALGWSDREWSMRVGGASWRLLFMVAERLLSGGASFILDSNFERGRHREFADIATRRPYRLVEVHCVADERELARRFRERWESGGRHPGHTDLYVDEDEYLAEFRRRNFEPLEESEVVIEVDTTEPERFDLGDIISRIREGDTDGPEDR